MKSKTILFIHGMYMTPLCWEHWLEYFQAKGYRCIAPAWPGRDKPVEELRKKHPDPELGQLTLSWVIGYFNSQVRALDEKPILIGHSMGALIVQSLLQKGGGRCRRRDRTPPRPRVSSPPVGLSSDPTCRTSIRLLIKASPSP